MLSSLIRLRYTNDTSPTPEDIFTSSLGLIFTDDLANQHGDLDARVAYLSRRFGPIELAVADPTGEEERQKFAHYLWNAGVLMGELVGGRGSGGGHEEVVGMWEGRERGWWVDEGEEERWKVEGHRVLELGAGVGLGGVVSTLAEAESVAITDYPAPTILDTLQKNVSANIQASLRTHVSIHGHQWGILDTPFAQEHRGRYTRILAADCLWMPWEHNNLARSMLHFLSPSPDARVFVIAGFHTGRRKVAPFFEQAVPEEGLEVEEIWEVDANARRRDWDPDRAEESIGERKKWLVVARLKRRSADASNDDVTAASPSIRSHVITR